ncbi:MAG TPA: hypothetical protein ENN28_02885 [Candidatus Uhrbacteria bacterium]|nr:hypothetical protein [Candidatus Uhrbacteria bacterium]
MPKIKILIFLMPLVLILSACDLKFDINSNLNQLDKEADLTSDLEQAEDTEDGVESENGVFDYEIITDEEKMVLQIKTSEVVYQDFKALCGIEMMVYAQPADSGLVILQPFNPGSDRPLSQLFSFNLENGSCVILEISRELSDFGARVLSPDQNKMALALEADEAQVLKILDLVNDKALTLVNLPESETLNAGYGALSNHFDIKWLDNKTLQYTVFENTIKNYPRVAPEQIERVLQVRVVNVE